MEGWKVALDCVPPCGVRELLARAMYGIAHPHGNDTQVAVGSSGARHRGSRADVTVRPQSPLTIVSRRRLRQFALTSRLSVWLKACLKTAHTRLRIRRSNGETRVVILRSQNGCKNSGKIWWMMKFHYREALTPVLLMKFL